METNATNSEVRTALEHAAGEALRRRLVRRALTLCTALAIAGALVLAAIR